MQYQEASSRGRAGRSPEEGCTVCFGVEVLIINDINLSLVVLYFLQCRRSTLLFIYKLSPFKPVYSVEKTSLK